MKKIYIALVGGPCTGKTTVAKELSKKGYRVIEESSRALIEEQQAINGKILPWVNRDLFQKEVLKMQIKKREAVKEEGIVFEDTSIPCGIAYYLADGLKPPIELLKKSRENQYDLVFLFDFHLGYETDEIRKENKEKSILIHNHIKEIHEKLGHKMIVLPSVSVSSRIKIIEEEVKNILQNS